MLTPKREHDPLRTAEVLTLLMKHEERQQRTRQVGTESLKLDKLLKQLSKLMPVRRKKSIVGPGSRSFMQWCKDQSLPAEICHHFTQCSIRGAETSFGYGVLRDEKGIIESHKRDTQLLTAGLLNIASCSNGDLVVMDLKTRTFPIGYISHEHFWSPPPPQPREYLAWVAESLYDFLLGWEEGTLPCDYWDATREK